MSAEQGIVARSAVSGTIHWFDGDPINHVRYRADESVRRTFCGRTVTLLPMRFRAEDDRLCTQCSRSSRSGVFGEHGKAQP